MVLASLIILGYLIGIGRIGIGGYLIGRCIGSLKPLGLYHVPVLRAVLVSLLRC